ncbi:MAG: hypothetical protein ACOYNF_14785 [Rhodoferax sp.]
MASITLTITDTESDSVAIHSSFKPAIGLRLTPAQAHALDLISRTHKQWGQPECAIPATPNTPPPKS